MPEYVILTMQFPARGFETDLEVPSEMTFDALTWKLLELLRRNASDPRLQNSRNLAISFNGRSVSMDETPAQLGAFDGSRLQVSIY